MTDPVASSNKAAASPKTAGSNAGEPGTLQSVIWFPSLSPATKKSGVGSSLAKLAVGGAVGALLFVSHRPVPAYVVWAIAGVVGGISIVSTAAREAIDGLLARFGRAVGTVIGAVLLSIVYALVVTPTRFVRRLFGADDLHLRDAGRDSYWLACDTDERKVRWVGTMFATEVKSSTGHPVVAAAVGLVALVLIAELVPRFYGFGHTVLYVADPDVGYYPQPSAELVRYGGRVATNKFGMRSPEVDRQKPPGTFRILMIGDSTLYGGSYVDQEDVYSTQVLKRLNANAGGRKIEVLAMGCNGWGPFHERGFIHKYPDAFGADLVALQMPIDDVERPLYGLAQVPFFPVQKPPRFGLEEIFNSLIWRYREERSGKDDDWAMRQSVYGIQEYGALVDDIQHAGAEVMLFVLPRDIPGFDLPPPVPTTQDPEDRDVKMVYRLTTDEQWRTDLNATVAKRGVKGQYARGYFKGKGARDEIYRDDGVHLNPKGHHVYAEFIEDKIRTESARFQAWSSGNAGSSGNTNPGSKP